TVRVARCVADGTRRARGRGTECFEPAPAARTPDRRRRRREARRGHAGEWTLRAGRARARRAEGHDRVRYLTDAYGARIRADGGPVRRNAGERALVSGAG